MKIYTLERKQFLPITLEEAWSFFSTPQNLSLITPPDMEFHTLYQSGGDQAYAGQIIQYRIKIMPMISVEWVTEITHLKEAEYFVDEQRFGPYSLWHHQHHFKSVNGGVEMTDMVNYAVPFGALGRLAHLLFVGKKVRQIFEFRYQILENHFQQK